MLVSTLKKLSLYRLSNIQKYMLKRIRVLVWPLITEMLCLVVGGVLTTAMVGRFGAVEIASIGLATIVQITVSMVIASAGIGAGSLISRAIGARKPQEARQIAGQTLFVGVLIGIFAAALIMYSGRTLIAFASSDVLVVKMAGDFVEMMAAFFPFLAVISISLASVRATGQTRISMMVAIIGQFVSIATTYSLLFVFEIGVYGAVFGMVSSQVLAAFLSILAIRSNLTLGLRKKDIFPLQPKVILEVFKISMPAAFEQLAIQSGRLFFSLLMVSAGAAQYAGHNVAIQIESISFMPGMAFGIAAMTLVGQNLGRGLPHRARQYAWFTCFIGASTMGFLGVLFYFFAEPLTRFFVQDPAVLRWGVACVKIAAIEQVSLAVAMILPGVLRGAGDTVSAMYVAVFGAWVFRIPLLLILKYFGYFDVIIGWTVTFLDFTIRALLFIYIVRRQNWQALARKKDKPMAEEEGV